MKKLVSLLLAVLMLAVLFAPAAMADGGPSRADMRGYGDIYVPADEDWLSEYGTGYVCTSGGVAAFLFRAPSLESEKFDTALEGMELTLLARRNDFYLIKTPDKRVGWICAGCTSDNTDLVDSVPEIEGTVWVVHRGDDGKNDLVVRFNEKRMADVYYVSNGAHLRTGWILSIRRVLIDDTYYVWDGEQFVSRDEFRGPDGSMIHYTVTPDTDNLIAQFEK